MWYVLDVSTELLINMDRDNGSGQLLYEKRKGLLYPLSITILHSYLMGVQVIDQTIFPDAPGKTKVLYCPR